MGAKIFDATWSELCKEPSLVIVFLCFVCFFGTLIWIGYRSIMDYYYVDDEPEKLEEGELKSETATAEEVKKKKLDEKID